MLSYKKFDASWGSGGADGPIFNFLSFNGHCFIPQDKIQWLKLFFAKMFFNIFFEKLSVTVFKISNKKNSYDIVVAEENQNFSLTATARIFYLFFPDRGNSALHYKNYCKNKLWLIKEFEATLLDFF